MRIAIIGAGASGCFCAALIAEMLPGTQIEIFEKNSLPLAKLARTGGGRCNITNTFESAEDLRHIYPRGYGLMKKALKEFPPETLLDWFREKGVRFITEEQGRVFPESNKAGQICDILLGELAKSGVRIHLGRAVGSLRELDGFDSIVISTGGGSCSSLIPGCESDFEPCVPSLFSLRLEGEDSITSLSGISLPDCAASINGSGISARGPLLITHRGLSGPCILKLSSYGARQLAASCYKGAVSLCYMPGTDIEHALEEQARAGRQKEVRNTPIPPLPARLWEYLVQRSGIRPDARWAEVGSKGFRRLAEILRNDVHCFSGRDTNKEEFVSCGGLRLDCIESRTMRYKKDPRLYFTGEVLDIDAVTGGYNLQAAWSTAFLAAKAIASSSVLSI